MIFLKVPNILLECSTEHENLRGEYKLNFVFKYYGDLNGCCTSQYSGTLAYNTFDVCKKLGNNYGMYNKLMYSAFVRRISRLI